LLIVHFSFFAFHRASLAMSRVLLPAGLVLTGMGGAFLPWVWREPVALQLTAPGLAEFVKFLPEVRLGQAEIERLYFLWPLFLSMLALPLLIENRALGLPVWVRWPLRLVVIPLALASLSPVWTPGILVAPEFRWQTLLAGIALVLTVVAPWLTCLPLRLLIFVLVGLNVPAVILPIWQFSLVQPGLVEADHGPVSLGWGWLVTVAGILLSTMGGLSFLYHQTRGK
jgi:hypothetical protein